MNTNEIYKEVAQKNGVSVQEVRAEMQKAIDEAWDNPNKSLENEVMQHQVKPDGTKPTPEELIQFCAERIREKQ